MDWSSPDIVQLAVPHGVVPEFAKPPQLVRVLPSHVAFAQSVADFVSHAVLDPCGSPVTGVQTPGLALTSHASHCPSQAVLQQTPSAQTPVAHSAGDAHMTPFCFKHWPTFVPALGPAAVHAAPVPHEATEQQTPSVQKVPAAH